jgi:dienelactone hydrolase
MNEGRPSYREEATRDAWRRTIDWFSRYLAA